MAIMTLHKKRTAFFLIAGTLAILMLSGTLSSAKDITGNWQAADLKENKNFLFSFGPEHDFFIEPEVNAVFIGVDTDPSHADNEDNEDNEDVDWNVYASCFITGLAGIFGSP